MIGAAALLLGQYAGTLDIWNTSRIDARANQPLPVAPAPPPREVAIASDAYLTPTARLRFGDRRWDYALTYSPTFTVTDIELTSLAQPVVLNAGAASIAWHGRFVRIVVSESASYGWENLAYLYGTPVAGQPTASGQAQTSGQTTTGGTSGGGAAGPISSQPTVAGVGQTGAAATVPIQLFPFGSSTTTASVVFRTSRAVTMSISGGYSLSGNLTNSAQATAAYPEQFGPTAAASVAYTMSRADSLTTRISAQETTTPQGACAVVTAGQFCRLEQPVLVAEELERHRVSRTATLSASLGVGATVYQLVNGSAWGILPVGALTYADRFSAAPRDPAGLMEADGVRLSAEVAPTVNVFTGTPSNRLQLSASLVNHLSPRVVLAFRAGALQTVPIPQPDPSPLTLVSGGVDLRVRVTGLISVSAGVQGFWEAQQNVGTIPLANTSVPSTSASEVGYVALTVRLPRLRF